eukprot:TRINITY_DN57040_c0_g1_i1.p2 TRINITY_DN57040_c0_g1~~TRINITY_DN57040_c0_g1_i1.p2  ORF type:complete len:397 (+),score=77.95 TRINITY_DN57040_c0_g1_i1:126-1316(+)
MISPQHMEWALFITSRLKNPSTRLDHLEVKQARTILRINELSERLPASSLCSPITRGRLPVEDLTPDDTINTRRVRTAATALRLRSATLLKVPQNYYRETLTWRRDILNAPSISYLCKTMLMENIHSTAPADPDAPHALARTNSRWYLVVFQYICKLNTDKMTRAIHQMHSTEPSTAAAPAGMVCPESAVTPLPSGGGDAPGGGPKNTVAEAAGAHVGSFALGGPVLRDGLASAVGSVVGGSGTITANVGTPTASTVADAASSESAVAPSTALSPTAAAAAASPTPTSEGGVEGPLGRRKFCFRVAKEADAARLTGFGFNGVAPIGVHYRVPIIVDRRLTDPQVLPLGYIWLGGGEPDWKMRVDVSELVGATNALTMDVTDGLSPEEVAAKSFVDA